MPIYKLPANLGNMIGPILLLVTAGTAIAVAVGATNKAQAASDLKIDIADIELNPIKNIRSLRLNIPITLSIRNIRNTNLNLEAIDLAIQINGKTLASIRDYTPVRIPAVNNGTHKITASTGIANMAMVLGGEVLRMIGEAKAGNVKLRDVLPKEARLTGQIRAEGLVFDIDEAYPIVTEKSTPGGTTKK